MATAHSNWKRLTPKRRLIWGLSAACRRFVVWRLELKARLSARGHAFAALDRVSRRTPGINSDQTIYGSGQNPARSGNTSDLNLPVKACGGLTVALLLSPLLAGGQGYAVVAWGDNNAGQLNVPLYLTNAVAVAGGVEHSLALKNDGTVVGWGGDSDGQIDIPASATNVVAIAAGYYHSLALRADGTVVGWGDDSYGQIIIPPQATNVTAIAAGPNTSLALRADGSVIGWGQNQYGQTNTVVAGTNVIAIDCGYHGLALRQDTTVVGWGLDFWGQTNGAPAGSNVMAIAAGVNHSLALKRSGTVIAWGRNLEGQTNVPPDLSNVVAVSAGLEHSMALKSDRRVVVWGRNAYGETNVPTSLSNVVSIASGIMHCLALTTNYPVYPIPVTNVVGQPQLRLFASVATEYELEYRDSLARSNDWKYLDTVTPEVNPQYYNVPSVADRPQRFYRLVSSNDAPSALQFLIVPRLTLAAEVGKNYRLEYHNAIGSMTTWSLLAVVAITNNPQVYYDDSAVGQLPRVYRLFQTNAL